MENSTKKNAIKAKTLFYELNFIKLTRLLNKHLSNITHLRNEMALFFEQLIKKINRTIRSV